MIEDVRRDDARRGHEYAHAVAAGTVVASRWVRIACQRHLSDLEQAGWRRHEGDWVFDESQIDPEWPFYFDEECAADMLFLATNLRLAKGKGARRPFDPSDFQIFILVSLFGWLRHSDGRRRFRRLYIELARKQGKSVLAAIIAILVTFLDGEPGAEGYCGATTARQARIVFNAASQILRSSPVLRKRADIIVHKNSIGRASWEQVFEPMSSDAGTKDGADSHFVCMDEFHAHKDRDLYDVMEESTAARPQPLTLVITTAGRGDDPENPCKMERDRCTGVLERFESGAELWESDEQDFVFVACLDRKSDGAEADDDYLDQSTWLKAMPNLGVTVDKEYVRNKLTAAQAHPSQLPAILQKHFNLWVGSRESWLPLGTWAGLKDTSIDWADLEGEEAWGGLDLASSEDLAGWCLWFPRHQVLWAKAWVPEDRIDELGRKHRVPYRRWVEAGWLEPVPGDYMVPADIVTSMLLDASRFEVKSVAYDPAWSRDAAPHLVDAGIDMVPHPQGYPAMTPAVKAVEGLIRKKQLRHDGNGPLDWCVRNTVMLTSPEGLVKPTRKLSRNKIDLSVAMVMTIGWWSANSHQADTPYNDPETELAIV